jgi:signal transduction histidine kinase
MTRAAENTAPYLLAEILETASRQDSLSGLGAVLCGIAQAVKAQGCILWEAAPWADFTCASPAGGLFIQACWLEGNLNPPLHEINLQNSANGLAISSRQTQVVESIKTDPRTTTYGFIVEEAQLDRLCAAPVSFTDSSRPTSSLCLYRKASEPCFTPDEIEFIEQLARLTPILYRIIRDRVARESLEQLNKALENIEQQAKGSLEPLREIKVGLDAICRQVGDVFECVETSIFLENRLEAEQVYKLFATTWPHAMAYEKRVYAPRKEDGLTGWVLEHGLSVHIFDLSNFSQNKEDIRRRYDGVDWRDSLHVKRLARVLLQLPPSAALPPLSFMAAPITRGNRTIGVIRCCLARNAPWFFLDRQLTLLELFATQISRFWNDWLQHLEEKEENSSWKEMVEGISRINHQVQQGLEDSRFQANNLYRSTLFLARRIIRGAEVLDIRLLDESQQRLYFAETVGDAWRKGSKRNMEARLGKTFPVNLPLTDDGLLYLRVFQNKEALCRTEKDGYRSRTFPETKRIIVAPIGVQNKTIAGLLDIRGTSPTPFPPHALPMAKLLGQQLGLYLSLANSKEQQKQAKEQQEQAFEDLWHQLKGPIKQTFARAQSIVQEVLDVPLSKMPRESLDEIEDEMFYLRGLARKARRVAVNAGLFKDLASEHKLTLLPSRLSYLQTEKTRKMLKEANIDTQHALEDYMGIKFVVQEETFPKLGRDSDGLKVRVDWDLFEQAISCLLDNAGKYSYSNTRVIVQGGEETYKGNRYFYITVKNRGFPISTEETGKCKERKYQGQAAKWTVGEGQGIGLWVVDHIMRAHGGELVISPTTPAGWTDVCLLFPILT